MSKRRSPSYTRLTGRPPMASSMTPFTSRMLIPKRAIASRSRSITSCDCGPSCSSPLSLAPRTVRTTARISFALLRSWSGSLPPTSTARSAAEPVTASATLSRIGCENENEAPGSRVSRSVLSTRSNAGLSRPVVHVS